MGGAVAPASYHHATPAGPFGRRGAALTGDHFYRQTPVPTRHRVGRRPVLKSQNSSNVLNTGIGSEAYASRSGGLAIFQQGSVGSHQHPLMQAAYNRSGDFAHLLVAAYSGSATERQIGNLESQVSRLILDLLDVRSKDRQDYERLKLWLDLLEKLMLYNPRYAPDIPRFSSPHNGERRLSEGSFSPSLSPPHDRPSTHGRYYHRSPYTDGGLCSLLDQHTVSYDPRRRRGASSYIAGV